MYLTPKALVIRKPLQVHSQIADLAAGLKNPASRLVLDPAKIADPVNLFISRYGHG